MLSNESNFLALFMISSYLDVKISFAKISDSNLIKLRASWAKQTEVIFLLSKNSKNICSVSQKPVQMYLWYILSESNIQIHCR